MLVRHAAVVLISSVSLVACGGDSESAEGTGHGGHGGTATSSGSAGEGGGVAGEGGGSAGEGGGIAGEGGGGGAGPEVAGVCAELCATFAACYGEPEDAGCSPGCESDLSDCTPAEVNAVAACIAGSCDDLLDCFLAIACVGD